MAEGPQQKQQTGGQKSELTSQLAKLRREGEERAAERLAKKLGFQYVDLTKVPLSLDAVKTIPEEEARAANVAAIEVKMAKIALAAADPTLPATQKVVEDLTAKNFKVVEIVVSRSSLETAWEFYKFVKPGTDTITGKVVITKNQLDELRAKLSTLEAVQKEISSLDFAKASPTDLIQLIIAGSLGVHASDIHTEAGEKKARVRLRVDGLLHDVYQDLPPQMYASFVSRIKLLSGMKLNIRDEAQDGRFTILLGDKEVEMRVSVIPAEFGETIVMRILDPAATMAGLASLGLREENLELVKKQIARPNGLILNTGPTGSGKTTTLYAFLRTINDPTLKIITLEDPIEYRIEGIEQTQVDDEAGYTFANGLRAIVRQDPDVILVGEIRDLETADIAMQAALTGHLVLSTLHTNDAVGAVPRLINLGVKAVSIGPALTLVIAQRLVRVLCPECKKKKEPDAELQANIKKFLDRMAGKASTEQYKNYALYEPVGCAKCNNDGYKGRVGIFEFLEGGPDLETTILKEASEVALRSVAERQKMVTMQEDGILKVLRGDTTLEEVKGETGEIVW